MPYEPDDFPTDKALFASLPGGQDIIDWFGFCPSFHDATLERLELFGDGLLSLRTHRMTNQMDEKGFYILDRHAVVTLHLKAVTGVKLEGDGGSIISHLSIRRLAADATSSDWPTCGGPSAGDIEIAFTTSIGLCGSLFTKSLEFGLQPETEAGIV